MVDTDLGVSGKFGADREGFRDLQIHEVVGRLVAAGQWKPGDPEVLVVAMREWEPAMPHMWRILVAVMFLDVLHRSHAGVEDRVRTNKAMGLHNLPSKSWEINRGWMLSANLAAGLDAWVRLLALHDTEDLADAEPDTMRFRLYHLPARLTKHARRRWLRIEATWPWRMRSPPAGNGSTPSRPSPDGRASPRRRPERRTNSSTPGPWNPAQPRRHATARLERCEDITGEAPSRSATEPR